MRAKAEIGAIREWLGTLNKEDCTHKSSIMIYSTDSSKRQWPGPIDWPESLKVFKPRFVRLGLDENDNPKIRLFWGTGMTRCWGVEIGSVDMEIPPSDLDGHGERRLPLERGAYVWYEMR